MPGAWIPDPTQRRLILPWRLHPGSGTVAEARWYGSQFLVGMSEGVDNTIHRDAIEDLYHAAALYAGDHSLMWQLWDLAGGIYNPDAWKQFSDPGLRRRMIPIIPKPGITTPKPPNTSSMR